MNFYFLKCQRFGEIHVKWSRYNFEMHLPKPFSKFCSLFFKVKFPLWKVVLYQGLPISCFQKIFMYNILISEWYSISHFLNVFIIVFLFHISCMKIILRKHFTHSLNLFLFTISQNYSIWRKPIWRSDISNLWIHWL